MHDNHYIIGATMKVSLKLNNITTPDLNFIIGNMEIEMEINAEEMRQYAANAKALGIDKLIAEFVKNF